jgi:predicted nucleotidyltransferase
MVLSVDEQQDEIAAACRQYGIKRLFLFCSAIRDYFRLDESDIDLLVEFGSIDITKNFHACFDVRDAFRRIFNAYVGLAMRGAVKSKIVASEINRTRKLIYAA